jgi:hypothetical protein
MAEISLILTASAAGSPATAVPWPTAAPVSSIPPATITSLLALREQIGTAFTYVTLKAAPLEFTGIYRPVLTQEGKAGTIVGPAFAVQPAS